MYKIMQSNSRSYLVNSEYVMVVARCLDKRRGGGMYEMASSHSLAHLTNSWSLVMATSDPIISEVRAARDGLVD